MAPARYARRVTTDKNGAFAVAFPSGLFSVAPVVPVPCVDAGGDGVYSVRITITKDGCSGTVKVSLLNAVGVLQAAVAAAGVTLNVVAVESSS